MTNSVSTTCVKKPVDLFQRPFNNQSEWSQNTLLDCPLPCLLPKHLNNVSREGKINWRTHTHTLTFGLPKRNGQVEIENE